MKKVICIVLIAVILLLCGCRSVTYHNKKPDDAISTVIYEAVGDRVYYQGKCNNWQYDLCYEYIIKENEEQTDFLYDIVIVVNKIIEEDITNRVDIVFFHELPGGSGQCIELSNYSDYKLEYPDYEGLQALTITGFSDFHTDCIFDEPSIYLNLPNIKYLKVSERVQKKADDQGIDWYDYWPDLESVEVF